MESWSFVSGGKELASNETISFSDTLVRGKNGVVGWDLKSPCAFGSNILVSCSAIQDQGFGEQVYQELIGKQVPDDDSIRYASSCKVEGGKVIHSLIASPNKFTLEGESTSRLSGTVVDSNCKGSSFIDLKLGRFVDPRAAQNSRISKGTVFASSSESSTHPKKARAGVTSHTPYCQVYGCNKDLSSSKEYHKRHKVCDVHSKTAKVIVKGIEQRFCQQCSRFHLLAEFDDGKRSCRKRLAGHNERRRKPQVSIHSGRTGRLLQSYNGRASFLFVSQLSMLFLFFVVLE
ncbi:hypothetical protein Tsubulata_049783 [Turnera subulata]|uniref:SBP-type domain-containing protein n=1 Tax=Turnera subulata TaxID=218843 RepID=A0A9Q0JLR3_9ROSI|nr:hypothetical protein Tsubulata_049783 [Turnera subulata]